MRPDEVLRIAVLGAGTMGIGIAQTAAAAGYEVWTHGGSRVDPAADDLAGQPDSLFSSRFRFRANHWLDNQRGCETVRAKQSATNVRQ